MPAGYFSPTNILKVDDYFYFMAWMVRKGFQRPGSCLFRTRDLSTSAGWRGWDGHDFTVRFIDPYREIASNASDGLCSPVGQEQLLWPVNSLMRHESGLFVAVMQGTSDFPKDAVANDGVYLAYSHDLVAWSKPTMILKIPSKWKFDCQGPEPIMAPALLDPRASDQNFAYFGNSPFLYYSQMHIHDCKLNFDIDLIRVKLNLENQGQ
jgi:hypothetical protein